MIKTSRRLIVISAIGGSAVAAVASLTAWLTGLFGLAATRINHLVAGARHLIDQVVGFFNQPIGPAQILAMLGGVMVPLCLTLLVFAILDDN